MKLLPAFLFLTCIAAEPVEMTPVERAQFAAAQMADVAELGRDSPSDAPRKLSDVVDFEWIDNRLLPTTSLTGNFQLCQPLIGDTARCLIQRIQQRSSSYIFEMQLKRFDPKTLAVESIRISRFGNGTLMSLTVVDMTETLMIQITDTQSPDENGEPSPIRLFWQVTPTQADDEDSEPKPMTKLEAPTLLEMIREQRHEAVPMLRRLFNSIRRPDIIGRALNPLWIRTVRPWIKSPPAILEKVTALVAQLDAEEYADRQKAFDLLSAMDEEARLVLISLDQSSLSYEQRSSISALLEQVREVDSEEIDRISNSATDLVDGLYAPSPTVREAIRSRIESLTKSKLDIDTNAEPSIEVVESIRAKIEKLNAP